jgi:two-component sensor histidine kinase
LGDKPVRVLLVDDDEDDFVITRDLLRQVTTPSCVLEWSRTYDEGLATVLEGRHDLYLIDYNLGARDGVEIVRAAVRESVRAPLLLLTARDDPQLDDVAAAAGASDYLVKGHLTAPLLGRAIRYALARQRSVEALRRAAEDKTVLLQEVHHRVKNNLQIISSLLNFQMDHVKDAATLGILRETQARVHSIALIHEKLYQSPQLASVDMAEYTRGLAAMLMQTHGKHALVEVRAVDIVLPADIGLPCGLIVSELVTNALKHAFPEPRRDPPTILIEFERVNGLTVSVTDNGVGLRESTEGGTRSLGLRLIGMFAEQLGGTVRFSSDRGTRCVVTFPVGQTN